MPCHRQGHTKSVEAGDELLCELGGQTTAGDTKAGDAIPCSHGFSQSRPVPLTQRQTADPEIATAVLLPLTMGDETTGWLRLSGREEHSFSEEDLAALDHLAQSCAIALVSQRAQAALRERVKELTGLYKLAQLSERPDISLDELLQGIAALLPPAWQYPEIAVGRIVLDGHSYSSDSDPGSKRCQRSAIVVGGLERGLVEVSYREERPELDEGPFLTEERSLLDAIAHEVAAIMERRETDAERERLHEQLLHADRLATIGELAAGVAHELNEPLGAVLGFAGRGLLHPVFVPGVRRAAGINLGLNVLVSFLPQVNMAAHFGGGAVGALLILSGALTRGLPRFGPGDDFTRPRTTPAWITYAAAVTIATSIVGLGLAWRAGEPWISIESRLEVRWETVSYTHLTLPTTPY